MHKYVALAIPLGSSPPGLDAVLVAVGVIRLPVGLPVGVKKLDMGEVC